MLCIGFGLAGLFYRHVARRKRTTQQTAIEQASTNTPPPPRDAGIEGKVSSHEIPADPPSYTANSMRSETLFLHTPRDMPYPSNVEMVPSMSSTAVVADANSSSSSFANFLGGQSSDRTPSPPNLPSLKFTPPNGDIGRSVLNIDGQPMSVADRSQPIEQDVTLGLPPLPETNGIPPTTSVLPGLPQSQRVPYDQWRFGH